MRLSEKGCVHLNEWMVHKLPIDAFEFRSEDFTDCVVLTVEEAKVIANFFGAVDACCDLRMSKTEQKTWGKLNKRIEQTEKKK